MRSLLTIVAAGAIGLAFANYAGAQVTHITYYTPAVPVTTFFAPAAIPVTTYHAPAVPVTTFFAPAPVVTFRPVSVATTRYRPILGGTVTRFRTALSPVMVNPLPVVYAY
jgi:hypothetical protein